MIKEIKSLIFIDDDPTSNYIHSLVLKKLNLHIEPKFFLNANDGLAYLSKIDNPKTHLEIIFVDINMPVMDGWDFVSEYTNTFYKPERKQFIIMFSSSIAQDDINKAAGYEVVFDLVEKPLSSTLLMGMFGNLLQERKNE